MENVHEQQISQIPDNKGATRLDFKQLQFGRIPYKLYFELNYPSSNMVDEKRPGRFMVTPDRGGGKSLSIFIHESVPAEFKDCVAFHELTEAELVYVDRVEIDQAHLQATVEEEKYARRHLTEEELEKFVQWRSTLNMKKI